MKDNIIVKSSWKLEAFFHYSSRRSVDHLNQIDIDLTQFDYSPCLSLPPAYLTV